MISWTVVLVMLLLASDSYSTDDWPKREVYFKRKNISGTIEYVIKLCASGMEDNKLIQRCANYKWKSNDNKNVTHECKVLDSSKEVCDGRRVLELYAIWRENSTCKCCSATSKIPPAKIYTSTVTSTVTPVTHCNGENSSQLSKSGKILATLVALLAALLALVISGWVWTCWTVKKLRQQIKSSRTDNILMSLTAINTNTTTTAYASYENASPEGSVSHQATSTDSSLLHHTTKQNSKIKEDASYSDINAPEYHRLDRGKESSKVKTSAPRPQQRGRGAENYSILTFD